MMADRRDLFMRQLLDELPMFRADLEAELALQREEGPDSILDPPSSSEFLMTVTLNARDRYLAGGQVEAEQFRALLAYLESRLGDDPEIDELIEAWALSVLPAPGEQPEGVFDLLPPQLHERKLRMDQEDREAFPASLGQFLDRLAVAVPAVREKLDEHIKEYRWALPHTFLEEVVAEAKRLHLAGRTDEILPFLAFLESEFGADPEVDNLIAISFLDELPGPGEPGADLELLLGPKLRGELQRLRNWPG
jgi:hypothetical protein